MLPVVWIVGVSGLLGRIDTEITRGEFGGPRLSWDVIEPLVTGSWVVFWVFALVGGIVSGALIYLVGGWWYRVRVKWSGSARHVDKRLPRYVYCWSSLIAALPFALLVAGFTFAYPNYLVAYHSENVFSLVLAVAIFWSVGVSYVGVTESFSLSLRKARIWFLFLPTLFYLVGTGLVVWLVAGIG